jgi:RNA polymerase sigma-70 factor (ECF subfamily)
MDGDDLFQEIAIQVWASIPRFKNDCAESTWIYRIALNTALKWTRNEQKHQRSIDSVAVEQRILTEVNKPQDDRLAWLYTEISRFDKVDRSITLLLLDGYSYREMAEIVGISESNVGVKINRIKRSLIKKSEEIANYGI